MFRKDRLMVPGPTPLPDVVVAAGTSPMVDERTPEFAGVFTGLLDGLRRWFGTTNDVLLFTSSTTGALESAVQNLFSAGDRVLVLNHGAFGARLTQLCTVFGLDVVEEIAPWGQEVAPSAVAARLASDPRITGVLAVHCETSTGVVSDLAALGRATREVLTVVDSASGLGGCELRADDWGLDVVVSGSQKALMGPPGLSFASVSERAWRRHERARLPRFYFDWSVARANLDQLIPRTPWTPAVGVLRQLGAAVQACLAEGIEERVARHVRLGRLARAGLAALGLPLLTPSWDRNAITTAAYVPGGGTDRLVRTVFERTGVQLVAGNGTLGDDVIRLGHCGHVDEWDVLVAISALESVLAGHGRPELRPGTGAAAILTELAAQRLAQEAADPNRWVAVLSGGPA